MRFFFYLPSSSVKKIKERTAPLRIMGGFKKGIIRGAEVSLAIRYDGFQYWYSAPGILVAIDTQEVRDLPEWAGARAEVYAANLEEARKGYQRAMAYLYLMIESWGNLQDDFRIQETEPQERKKNTSEVAPAVLQESNEKHGGDGNSREVEHPASSRRESESTNDAKSEQDSASQRNSDQEGNEAKESSGDSAQSQSWSQSQPSEKQSNTGSPAKTHDTDSAKQSLASPPSASEQAQDQKADNAKENASNSTQSQSSSKMQSGGGSQRESVTEEQQTELSESFDSVLDVVDIQGTLQALKEHEEERNRNGEIDFRKVLQDFSQSINNGNPQVSHQARQAWGGVVRWKNVADLRLARRLVDVLNQFDEQNVEGLKWNLRKISNKLITLRQPNINDRRLEQGRPVVLFIFDFSGSMGGYVKESSKLLNAALRLGAGVSVLVALTSNAIPFEVKLNSKVLWQYKGYIPSNVAEKMYKEMIQRFGIKYVLVFADWDGEWIYRFIAEQTKARLIWLSNVACNYGAPVRRDLRVDWSKNALRKTVYYERVGSAEDFVSVLEKVVRNI